MYFDVAIRELKLNDLKFLYNSFVKNLTNTPPYSRVDRNVMSAAAHSIMTKMLKNCKTLVAYNPADVDQMFGYIIGDSDNRHLFYAYVKWDFRKLGIGRRLMEAMFGHMDDKISLVIPMPSYSNLASKWNLEINSTPMSKLTKEDRNG